MSSGRVLVGRRGFSVSLAAFMLAGLSKHSSQAIAAESQVPATFKGTLYPIGGAAATALRRFSELAGGSTGKIVILPHASSTPKETADELANEFMANGVKDTETIMPGEKKSLPQCTAIFMSGGDQSRLMRLLDHDFMEQMKAFLRDGGLVGGTSAGAAAVAPRMIADGMGDGLPKSGALLVTDGLGLLPGYIVDTHVQARARQDRLMVGLSMVPGVKGIGLDEDTAVEIKDGKATVRGHGVAHVYRRSTDFNTKLPLTPEGNMASVQNVIYSIFPPGESFEL